MDADVFEVVAFEASFSITRVSVREGGINRHVMDGSRGMDFMAKFHTLDG